jgi:hypothetical protein
MHNAGDQGAYTTEGLEGDNVQYAKDLGLGVPKYDLLELGKQMDDAIRRECFKEGKLVSGKRKRRATVGFEHGLQCGQQAVLHCMEAADEKLAWWVVSGQRLVDHPPTPVVRSEGGGGAHLQHPPVPFGLSLAR